MTRQYAYHHRREDRVHRGAVGALDEAVAAGPDRDGRGRPRLRRHLGQPADQRGGDGAQGDADRQGPHERRGAAPGHGADGLRGLRGLARELRQCGPRRERHRDCAVGPGGEGRGRAGVQAAGRQAPRQGEALLLRRRSRFVPGDGGRVRRDGRLDPEVRRDAQRRQGHPRRPHGQAPDPEGAGAHRWADGRRYGPECRRTPRCRSRGGAALSPTR